MIVIDSKTRQVGIRLHAGFQIGGLRVGFTRGAALIILSVMGNASEMRWRGDFP